MPHKCENFDCDNQVYMDDRRFCGACNANVVKDVQELEKDLDRRLSGEAGFVDWCLEHGLPHPHE